MFYTFCSELYNEMETALDQARSNIQKENEKYAGTLSCIHHYVQRLEAFVLEFGFESPTQEVEFFKCIYPRFYCWFSYYTELFSIDKLLPANATDLMLRDYYLAEYNYQHRFFNQNRILYDYYLEGHSDRDDNYFLRANYQPLLPLMVQFPVNLRFLTNASYAFSRFMAFERLQEYVGRKLRLLYRNPNSTYVEALLKGIKRKWTGDKIELVEIAYGIYYTRRMNEGKAEVRDIVEWLEDSLGVDLSDAYRMFADLQRRKASSYTKYLEEMIAAIHTHIEEKNRFKVIKRNAK
uniref:RteC domain-containing protein n=1 Tax=Pedobacter schmidteae TaxID=2201271 RepID=UPI0013CED1AC|nr:RteC domain-containing protein [Pedobacter schmidteae]